MGEFEPENFLSFLESSRKNNGEKLLEKSMSIYVRNIERFFEKFDSGSLEEMIGLMNDVLKNNQVANIRSAFKWFLIYYWDVEKNDERLSLIRKLDKKASALTSVRILSNSVIPKKDIKLLFDSIEDDFHRLCYMLLYQGALRRIEIFSIYGRDIEFVDDGNIKVIIRVLGKGGKKINNFFNQDIVDLIKKVKPDLQSDEALIEFKIDDEHLYKRQDKRMADLFEKYTEKYLGAKCNLHMLKHSRLTHLLESGVDFSAVSKVAKHASIQTTVIYTQFADNIARNAMRDVK